MQDYSSFTDEVLFDLIKEGDQHAFSYLYNRYKRPLVAFALKKLEGEEVEDIVHDLFIKLWTKRGELQINQLFKSYIYRALRNKILDFIAHQTHERKYLDSLLQYAPSYQDNADYHLREEQFMLELDKLLEKYNDQDKQILKMRMEGYTNPEIAVQLGLSEKTIRNRFSLITKVLGSKLRILSIYFLF